MRSIFFVLLMLMGFLVKAQDIVTRKDLDKKAQKWYKEAAKEGRKKSYRKSIKLYNKVLNKYPGCVDALLNTAGQYHNLKEYNKSIEFFDKAIDLAPDYNPLAYFSLAIVYRDKGELLKAADLFDQYTEKGNNDEKIRRARRFSERYRFIHFAKNNPVEYKPKPLEGDVNSKDPEYTPVLTMEGDRLIFTRRVRGQEDFYIAEMKDGRAVRVVEIEDLNTPQNEGVHTMSSDGKTLIFTACDRRNTGMGSCDLFITNLDSDYWRNARNMGEVINTIYWDAQPSLSADGHQLFFSSRRRYGLGGADIWMSTRTDTSGWTVPINLGESINSEGDDESPFIHPDGQTLYFRSNGHIGMGGFDIFYSRFNPKTKKWSKAKNIGYPINTEGAEGAMTVSLDGKTAFFASNKDTYQTSDFANLDIYTFELYEAARPLRTTYVKANIFNAKTKEPLRSKYQIIGLEDGNVIREGFSRRDGSFITTLPTDQEYAFYIEKSGYGLHSENYTFEGVSDAVVPKRIEIGLVPVKVEIDNSEDVTSKPIVLNNIFFESGSAILKEKSNVELDRLARNLLENKDSRIEVHGHTDNIGSETENKKLSENRAKSVVKALIDRGVPKLRLQFKGFGESLPIASNETEEGRSLNRRTEFVLIYE